MHFNNQILIKALDPDQYSLSVTFGNQLSLKSFQASCSDDYMISLMPGLPGDLHLLIAIDNNLQLVYLIRWNGCSLAFKGDI